LLLGVCLAGSLCTTAAAETPTVSMHNTESSAVLNAALVDEYWTDASVKTHNNQLYDEVRLKSLDSGYVPMITGEGQQDFDIDVVSQTVFKELSRLPKHMEGAEAVVNLGSGYDPKVGSEYVDTFYFVDLTLFYTAFTQRTYMFKDETTGTHYLFFEKVTEDMVDDATWAAYQKKMAAAEASVDKRWAFSSTVPASDVFGVYIIGPGDDRKTRVTLVSRIVFGAEASWVAQWGSKMPSVIKAGIKNGFNACVAIAAEEQAEADRKAG